MFHSNVANDSLTPRNVDGFLQLGGWSKATDVETQGKVIVGDFCALKRCNIGSFFGCGNFCIATDTTFGSFVSVGERVTINAGTHPKNNLSTHLFKFNAGAWGLKQDAPSPHFQWRRKLIVGSDVWIGSNSILLTGISVGHGAIIGANSVINADVPPYAICAGSPGRIVSYRFSPKIIQRLLDSEWWTLPIDYLMELPVDQVELCLSMLEAR